MKDPVEVMSAYFEGRLNAEQVAELEAWLREEPARAAALVRQAMLDCHLGELLREQNIHQAASDLSDDLQFDAMLHALEAPDAGVDPVDITDAVLQQQREREEAIEREIAAREAAEREAEADEGPRIIVIPTPVAWLSLAAAVVLVAMVGFELFGRQAPPVSTGPHADAANELAGPMRVGNVSASYNAAWVGVAPDSGQIIADQRLELANGVVELTFSDGGVVLVEAPAVFQATGPNAMRLLSGRLTANIPRRAHGFTVHTPHLNIVDLGTEFGVEVDPLRSSKADVFTGKVVATGLADNDQHRPVELTAGLAASANERGELEPARRAEQTRYYRSLSSYIAAPTIRGEGVYLSSRPTDVTLDALQSYDHIFVFMERARLAWTERLDPAERIGSGPVIGRPVDVFMVHFDPEPARPGQKLTPARRVTLTFDRPVLGLITNGRRLDQTDVTLGAAQTRYRDEETQLDRATARGTDLDDGVNSDTYTLSSDRQTLTITLHARDKADQMRIITQAAGTE